MMVMTCCNSPLLPVSTWSAAKPHPLLPTACFLFQTGHPWAMPGEE